MRILLFIIATILAITLIREPSMVTRPLARYATLIKQEAPATFMNVMARVNPTLERERNNLLEFVRQKLHSKIESTVR